jgi:hypothetical protein
MAKKLANVLRYDEWSRTGLHQAVSVTAESLLEEVAIPAEERRPPHPPQQHNDFFILHSLASGIESDLTQVNPPRNESDPLALQDVLVKHNHAETGLSKDSPECLATTWPAKRIASAMAGRVMLPWHSSMIFSHGNPAATSSRTSLTRRRVPRNVSCPWQIFGSAQRNFPIRFCFISEFYL